MTRFLNRAAAAVIACGLLVPGALSAQHGLVSGGSYDPSVPTPRSVLGYEIGERFTPHHLMLRYVEAVANASPRIKLDTVAYTFEGREVMMVTATSEANHARLAEIRAGIQRLADPRGASAAELQDAIRRTPAVVWLGHTVHGNEASGAEAALALIYQLAAGQDEETRTILDSLVVLIDPVQNPDGHERHVQDVMRRLGAFGPPTTPGAMIHSGTWPGPRTSHYHFDLNRDWFIHSHPETRGRMEQFRHWFPQVAADLHEMGSNSTYFFAPPMDPINKNIHETVFKWWDILSRANAAAFDRNGWSFFTREGYDEFFPAYGPSWPLFSGAAGMTFEQASSSGGAIRRTDGTVLTLRKAAMQHYAAAWATTLATARRRTERLRDFLTFRQTAITDHERLPNRVVVIERDAQGRADSLAVKLLSNGIEIRRLATDTELRNATEYGTTQARTVRVPAGSYVVDFAQPQGRLAKALLEPDAQLDSTFIREELEARRTGQRNRFYDITAWSLPFAYRVRAWTTGSAVGGTEPVTAAPTLASPAPVPRAGYGYAFEPGSEASIRMLAGLLADSVRVWYARRPFRSGEHSFPHGAFLVRVEPNGERVHEIVQRLAAESGARVVALASARVDEGTDLGSNSVAFIRMPKVALVGGQGINGNSFGFAWFAFDQRIRYPVTTVDVSTLAGPILDEFNVLVLPSASAAALNSALGEAGRNRLAAWVRNGGVLITVGQATAWLADERTGLSRLRVRRDTTRADGQEGAPLPVNIPGAIVRVVADTLSPLMAGVNQTEFPVQVSGSTFFEAPKDFRPGEVVARYAPVDRLRLAGYMWPEGPERVAGTLYLWAERVGRGAVIAFANDPNFRDYWRGLLPVFANAVFMGSVL